MDIIIKNAELSKHGCFKCYFRDGNYCYLTNKTVVQIEINERDCDCPIIEIPEIKEAEKRSTYYPNADEDGMVNVSDYPYTK